MRWSDGPRCEEVKCDGWEWVEWSTTMDGVEKKCTSFIFDA